MSERGSYVTSYIYCDKCFRVTKKIFLSKCERKYLTMEVIKRTRILAGKVGGLYAGEELNIFEDELIPLIKEKICHPITIAVISDARGGKIYEVKPEE